MKTFSCIAFAGALLSAGAVATPSMAADPVYWDQPSPTFTWSGFYAGVHAGAGSSQVRWTYVPGGGTAHHGGSGAFGGIQAGYNFQEGFWVFGAEGDIAYAGINGSTACPDAAWTCQSRINWLGSARLRAGVAFDRVLLYGTGGVGFGNVRIQTNNPASGTFGQSRTQVGWTLGAGAEFAVTDAWSVKAEYVYYDLGRTTYTVDNALNVSARTHVHTGKIGLNFRW